MTGTMNLSAPLAWAALVARFEPDTTTVEAQHGPTMVAVIDEPTLEIITHDLEIERWEAASDFLGFALEDFITQAEAVAQEEMVAEVLAEISALHEEPAPKPAPEPKEPTIEPEQLTIPEPPQSFSQPFERFGGAFEPSHDGRYAIVACQRKGCKHRIAGPLEMALESMEAHAADHAPAQKERVKVTNTKRRCDIHGVWARELDGRCKRCDDPEPVEDEAADGLEALMDALKAITPQAPKVTQATNAKAHAKVVLGVRGNGHLARRSAHVLAQMTGAPQRDLAKMTADEARAFTQEHGIEADWVPATELAN